MRRTEKITGLALLTWRDVRNVVDVIDVTNIFRCCHLVPLKSQGHSNRDDPTPFKYNMFFCNSTVDLEMFQTVYIQ